MDARLCVCIIVSRCTVCECSSTAHTGCSKVDHKKEAWIDTGFLSLSLSLRSSQRCVYLYNKIILNKDPLIFRNLACWEGRWNETLEFYFLIKEHATIAHTHTTEKKFIQWKAVLACVIHNWKLAGNYVQRQNDRLEGISSSNSVPHYSSPRYLHKHKCGKERETSLYVSSHSIRA